MEKLGILGLDLSHPTISPLSALMLVVGFPNGDCAMESPADFLAVVEHRLIPARVRSVTKSLKVNTCCISVWAPACHDSIPGGHGGVGVVSLKAAPLTLPTFYTPDFGEFFRFGQGHQSHITVGQRYYCSLFCGLWVSGF